MNVPPRCPSTALIGSLPMALRNVGDPGSPDRRERCCAVTQAASQYCKPDLIMYVVSWVKDLPIYCLFVSYARSFFSPLCLSLLSYYYFPDSWQSSLRSLLLEALHVFVRYGCGYGCSSAVSTFSLFNIVLDSAPTGHNLLAVNTQHNNSAYQMSLTCRADDAS
jgi:hypothetical protein